mgnify:CR=1 FL=1
MYLTSLLITVAVAVLLSHALDLGPGGSALVGLITGIIGGMLAFSLSNGGH